MGFTEAAGRPARSRLPVWAPWCRVQCSSDHRRDVLRLGRVLWEGRVLLRPTGGRTCLEGRTMIDIAYDNARQFATLPGK